MDDEKTLMTLERIEDRQRTWEENQRWQLNQIREQLKNIGYMANWCAAALLVIAGLLVKEIYFK